MEPDGTILVSQPEIDMAMLGASVLPQLFVPATLGNPGGMQVGDDAYVVGNPFGLYSSMSAGVISGFNRTFQPDTARPYIVSRRATAVKRDAPIAGPTPVEVVIYVPTQGASIGYTTEDGAAAKWRLYTGPILVKAPMTLRAKAIRYGYKESVETRVTFTN